MRYESQFGQDKWVETQFPSGYRGYFMEIGAYNGINGSNCIHFEYDLGWQGVCVEPDIISFEQCKVNRGVPCLNVAIGDRNCQVSFIPNGDSGNGMEGVDEDGNMDPIKCTQMAKTVECITPSELLRRVNAPKRIDYLSIDTEGNEYSILKSFPFSEYFVKVITVEHNCHAKRIANIDSFLKGIGFDQVGGCSIENWYVNKAPLTF